MSCIPRSSRRGNIGWICRRPLAGEDLRTERSNRIEHWGRAGTSSFLSDGESDFNSETADILQRRKKRGGWVSQSGRVLGEGACGRDHHGVGNSLGHSSGLRSGGARGNHSESDRRKNVDVVALGNRDATTFEKDRREWRASRNERAAVCPANQIRGMCFGVLGGVRKRKNDGAIHLASHLSDDRLGKSGANCGESNEDSRANVMNDVR